MKIQPSDIEEPAKKRQKQSATSDNDFVCPYLDTVERGKLDFDFEKACSVSLSQINVYACLVCGKYFQGRGSNSHAYFHSMDENHHVFINLSSLKIYCLPDNYEIVDNSLADIQYAVNPTFTLQNINDLSKLRDKKKLQAYDLHGKPYIPGFIGLNNIKRNDYINVVIQALAHVEPLRNIFLLQSQNVSSELGKRFSVLVRKIWNSRAFKGHISPHELLQEIVNASGKRFKITEQSDAHEFFVWFLNGLHKAIGGDPKKPRSSLIFKLFQGELEMKTKKLENIKESSVMDESSDEITLKTVPFLFISLDLPTMPLFYNESDTNAIPQVSLESLLRRYQGEGTHIVNNEERKYNIKRFPPFLLLHMKRFGKNNWSVEKNITIVNFPHKNLILTGGNDGETSVVYNLIANIVHEGKAGTGQGQYKVQILDSRIDQWYLIQDLDVQEIIPEMLQLSEAYIQIWARQQ